MKIRHIFKTFLMALPLIGAGACSDEVSSIGGSLVANEAEVVVDTITINLNASSVFEDSFDGRSTVKMLGRINVPEYGALDCSYVSRLMCSSRLAVPDSITLNDVDSMRCVLTVPRGQLTGDSLAPQQLKVYALNKSLPENITSSFDPKGYYDRSTLLGVKGYTLSTLSKKDSLFYKDSSIQIPVKMPDGMAQKVFAAYRDPAKVKDIFSWPANFEKYFHGIYVEQNFGNGCIGLISSTRFYLYWHRPVQNYVKKDDDSGEYHYVTSIVRDSTCVFASQPEVLSSNRVKYTASQSLQELVNAGKTIITTPGGYHVKYAFPLNELRQRYEGKLNRLSVISQVAIEIPAQAVKNNYGLSVAPTLLMVKASDYQKFFDEQKVPDNKTSFYASYDSTNQKYSFAALRNYVKGLLESGEEIKPEDLEFVLVPVSLTTETSSSSYGYGSTTYVTGCSPYIGRPTMTALDMQKAKIYFTFTRQMSDL